MQKLLVSIILLSSSVCLAQQRDSSKLFVMAGIHFRPFTGFGGYSTATTYSIQAGSRKYPIKAIAMFGFATYSPKVETTHTVDYTIRGSYLMPGVRVYSDEITDKNNVFYVGLMAYLGQYKHSLNLTINDTNWNTTQNYHFSGNDFVKGFVFEIGGLFTIYKKLKGVVSTNTGAISSKLNPLPQISNFSNVVDFTPGAGNNRNFLIGITIGLSYQLY
jgi:hypothetical protein